MMLPHVRLLGRVGRIPSGRLVPRRFARSTVTITKDEMKKLLDAQTAHFLQRIDQTDKRIGDMHTRLMKRMGVVDARTAWLCDDIVRRRPGGLPTFSSIEAEPCIQ